MGVMSACCFGIISRGEDHTHMRVPHFRQLRKLSSHFFRLGKKDESEKEAEALFLLSFLFPSFPCPARSHMCACVCVSSCRSRRTGIPATQCLSCPPHPSAFPNGKRKMSQTAEPETCRRRLQARHEMKKSGQGLCTCVQGSEIEMRYEDSLEFLPYHGR